MTQSLQHKVLRWHRRYMRKLILQNAKRWMRWQRRKSWHHRVGIDMYLYGEPTPLTQCLDAEKLKSAIKTWRNIVMKG